MKLCFRIDFSQKEENENIYELLDKSKEQSTRILTIMSQHTENDKEDSACAYLQDTQQNETQASSKVLLKTPTKAQDYIDPVVNQSASFANINRAQDAEIEAVLECVKSAREIRDPQMQILTSKRARNDTSPTVRVSPSMLPGLLQSEPEIELQSLKTIVVALSQKLKAQEVISQQMDMMKLNIEESEQ